MTERERNAMPKVGPRFFREAGEVMFEFVIDHGNIIGPRPATKADSENHGEAWSLFVAGEAAPAPAPAPALEPLPGAPQTAVDEKDMAAYETLIAPKRPYKRKAA